MDFKAVLEHFGSRNKIAKALGIKRQAITPWELNGIPELREYQLKELMNGHGKRHAKQGKHRAVTAQR